MPVSYGRLTLVMTLAAGAACSSTSKQQAADAAGGAGAGGSAGVGAAGSAGVVGNSGTAGAAGTGAAAAGSGAAGSVPPSDASLDVRDAALDRDLVEVTPADAPPAEDAAKLQACTMPSIDHLQAWTATQGEGDMVPSGGSLLVAEDDHYVAKVVLNGTDWHVLPVYLTNAPGGGMVDLSSSSAFTLTYSSTADLWIQMRPVDHWSGGTQWVTRIPSTNGARESHVFSLAPSAWSYLQALGPMPTWSYESARAQVRGFVFVGNKPNVVVFAGLRFEGYVPACRP